jgi:hypothetical protein
VDFTFNLGTYLGYCGTDQAVGDNVKVIGGADKGKISTVTRIYTHNSKVLLKDINLKTKHVKGKAEGEIGQIVQVGLWESFNTTLLHLTAEL